MPPRASNSSSHLTASPNTSVSSGGHLPTTLAARSRAAEAARGGGTTTRRFEDFDTADDADDTFMAARARKRPSDHGTSSQPARKPRRTLNEEADESGFIFTRVTQPGPSTPVAAPPPSSNSQPPSQDVSSIPQQPVALGRTISEALPSDQHGETPINQKNRLYRSGLATPTGKPRRPSGAPGNHRRSSLNFKEARQTSSMREASNSYPHPGIPDKELYRHISAEASVENKLRTLAGWALERSRLELLANLPSSSAAPMTPKGKRKRQDDQAPNGDHSQWTAQERKILERCRPTLEKVMLNTMRDLQEGNIDLSWLAESDSQTSSSTDATAAKRPNPENETNAALAETLSAQADALRAENAKWEEETRRIEAYETETAELVKAAASLSTPKALLDMLGPDVTRPPRSSTSKSEAAFASALSWREEDLGPQDAQMLALAREALAAEDDWMAQTGRYSSAPTSEEAEVLRTALQTAGESIHPSARRKSRSRTSTQDDAVDRDRHSRLLGTELDPRWQDFAFNADLLHAHTHLWDQLCLLSKRYTDSISSRAAQALKRLAFGQAEADSDHASSSAAESSNPESTSAEARRVERQRRDRLLTDLREPTSPIRQRASMSEELQSARDSNTNGKGKAKDEGADDSGVQIDDMDQSAVDLFRAFARTGGGTSTSSRPAQTARERPRPPRQSKR